MAGVDSFILGHREDWDALERLLRRTGQDPRRLGAPEIERLGQLYRHITSDLAIARRDYPGDQVTRYLNGLAARAHPVVYRADGGSWLRLARFFTRGVPELFAAARWFVAAALTLFVVPALAAYVVAVTNPPGAEAVLPPELTRVVRSGRLWTDMAEPTRPVMATIIMTNNIQVSFLAFAGGMLAGTLTAYVLVSNGLMFGAVLGYTHAYNLAGELLAFVSPHGYIELSIVFIAGGCGLQMAWAILNPGLLPRKDALAMAARRSVLLLIGVAPWLVVAGLIEGFISPSSLPAVAKYAFGPMVEIALAAYLSSGLRSQTRPETTVRQRAQPRRVWEAGLS
ncbi:MAG: stage II sporulation protein M [Chloroflexota bacterium]